MDIPLQLKEGHAIYMKRRRFEIVKEMLKKKGNYEYKRFLAEIELSQGVSKRKAKEYVELLKLMKLAHIKETDVDGEKYKIVVWGQENEDRT